MAQRPTVAPSRGVFVLWLGGLAAAVFVLAGVAVWFSPADYEVAVWWPAAGVSVLAVAHAPRRRWPVVLAVIWVAGSVANLVLGGRPPAVAVGLGLANTLEALVVAAVLVRDRARPALKSLDDVVRLVVATAAGVLVMGLVGGLVVQLTGYGDLLMTARTVMASHGAAILVIVPLGMQMLRVAVPDRPVERTVQTVALLVAMAAVFAPGQRLPLTFLPLPLLIWGAIRMTPRVVAAQTVAVGLLVTGLSTFGGPFAEHLGLGSTLSVSLAQAYLVMMVLVGMPLSVSIAMRRATLEGVTSSERLLRTGFSESLVGMLLLRRTDSAETGLEIDELNPVAARLLGRDVDLIGTDLVGRLLPTARDLLQGVVQGMEAGHVPSWNGELALRGEDGVRWIDVALSPLPRSVGDGMYVAQVVDVSARREAEDRLTVQALQDSLTGLANRVLLRDRIGLALETLAQDDDGGMVAVLFCDLDDFKHVNDAMGHSVGDLVLVELARRLREVVAPGDLPARHGGDEFVILRPRACDAAEVEALADAVLAALAEPVVVGENSFVVGASIGIVLGTPDATPDELLRDADIAMYAAKAQGKRRAVRYSDEHRSRVLRAVRLEGELRTALARDELVVHLQPVVDLRTDRVVAAEALVRWEHPERGLLGPGEWLDVAEDRGLMPELGAFVLERACRLAAAWPQPLAVHVNVSARQFEREGFVDVVHGALERSGLAPDRLVIEATETYLDDVSDALLTDLAQLRAEGVGLAADDFGTGYSPLTRLTELPLSMLKIDRRFVEGLLSDRRSRAVVTTLLRLGESLGLDVVAEGVETAEQAAALRVVGCTLGQGYLWSRAVPDERFVALLDEPTTPEPFGESAATVSPATPTVPPPAARTSRAARPR